MVSEARKRYKRKYYARTAFAKNHGKPWDNTECELVIRHEISDRELSDLLGRSVMAIQKKRFRLKKGA